MTTYQLMTLRFLRMKEEFPHLNHIGHEPRYNTDIDIEPQPGSLTYRVMQMQKARAEREFYRPVEKGVKA